MKRKIVQHGSSSLTITLPSKWVTHFGIKKGDEVDIEESGAVLHISTQHETTTPKKEIEANMFTKNDLSHLYQLGYDEIEIRYQNPKTLAEIKERIPQCIGLEILDQKPNHVHIKSIATTIDAEFDTLLRKSFQITNDMAKSLLAALKDKEFDQLEEIRSMESLNNRFTDVCIRILNKKGYKQHNRTMQMYEIVKHLERIADEFKYLCDVFLSSRECSKKEWDALKECIDYYLLFYTLFYQGKEKQKEKIMTERKKIMKDLEKKILHSSGSSSLVYHHCLNLITKTYESAGSYFALTL